MAESTATPTAPTSEPTGDDGKGGKAQVLADLASERDKRQSLEAQIQQLQQNQQSQTDALAKALGLKPEETSDINRLAAQMTALQESFTQTQHTNSVLSIANEHGITSKEDLALLTSVKDEGTMRALAARIKASDPGPGTPKPDLTQGGSGGSPTPASPAGDFATFLSQQLQ